MREELVIVVPRTALFAGRDGFQGFVPDMGPYLRRAMSEYLFVPRRRAERDERYKQIIPYVVIRVVAEDGGEPLYLMFQRAAGGDPRLLRLYSLGLGGHVNSGDVLSAPLVRRQELRSRGGSAGAGSGAPTAPLAGRWSWPRPVPATRQRGTAGSGRPPVDSSSFPKEGSARVVRRLRLDAGLRELLEPRARARVHEHPLFRGLRRELLEEVRFPRGATLSALGAINDDSDSVGRVHFGLAFVLSVPPRKSPPHSGWPAGMKVRRRPAARGPRGGSRVRIRPEPGGSVQVGSLFTLEQVGTYAGAMEGWSLLLLQAGVLCGGASGSGGAGRR